MTEEEVSKLYARLALQYEAVLGTLISKHLIFEDFVPGIRKDFYDTLNEDKLREFERIKEYDSIIRRYMREMTSDEFVSLTELAKQYSDESPGYVIQSWMRSRNTMEFLRLWENEMNAEFDNAACEELIQKAHTTSLTITPSLWIRETHAVGMYVKQGKGGGVKADPEIAADFHLWLNPKARLALVRTKLKGNPE